MVKNYNEIMEEKEKRVQEQSKIEVEVGVSILPKNLISDHIKLKLNKCPYLKAKVSSDISIGFQKTN